MGSILGTDLVHDQRSRIHGASVSDDRGVSYKVHGRGNAVAFKVAGPRSPIVW